MKTPDFAKLAQRFAGDSIVAIGLVGSFARGDAGKYSDIDLLRLARGEDYVDVDDGSHWIDERLVNVSTLTPSGIEEVFTDPAAATIQIAGLRDLIGVLDLEGRLTELRERAQRFTWNDTLQQRANTWASQQMVGWAEEAYKGLEGLMRDDPARLLHARFGCTWGLTNVVRVQRGILQSSDNALIGAIDTAMAGEPDWVRLRQQAFGLPVDGVTLSLRQQVEAGLQLYVATAELLATSFRLEDRKLIWATVEHIRQALKIEQA